MDFLSIQSSLGGLEERFNTLHEELEARLAVLLAERDAQSREIQEAQQSVKELTQQLEEKGTELQGMVDERDARAQEKGEAEQQVAKLKQLLESTQVQLEETSAYLSQKSEQATNASEEAELTLLQLHQVQEELEHYFLRSRDGDQLVEAQQHQLTRAQTLMGRLLPMTVQSHLNDSEAINVITPDVMSQSQTSVQTDALLTSYQKSLHRAAALLQRAIRS